MAALAGSLGEIGWPADLDGAAVDRDRCRRCGRKLAAAGAARARHADDLAGAHLEGDIVQDARRGEGCCTRHHDVADRTRCVLGLAHLAADHHADDLVVVELGDRLRADQPAVAQHRDAVGDAKTSSSQCETKTMPSPLLFRSFDHGEQAVDLGRRERCRRLVHDEDLGSSEIARAISTSCWSAGDRRPAGVEMLRCGATRATASSALLLLRLLDQPGRSAPGQRPSMMFSATDMAGTEMGVLMDGGDADAVGGGRDRHAAARRRP